MNISKYILPLGAVLLLGGSLPAADLIAHYRATSIAGAEAPPNYGLRLDGFYDGKAKSVVTFGYDNVFLDEFNDNTIRLSGTISVVKSTGSGNGEVQHVGAKYFLEVTMMQVTDPDSIAIIENFNPSWKYYTIMSDGLEMENVIDSGDHARLWSFPLDGSKPFQVGDGANGKNNNFGATGWLSFEHVIGGMIFGNTFDGHFQSSDFLMDLSQVTDVGDSDPVTNLPKGFELRGNYPNPFNPSTTIEYVLPKRMHVTIDIYNTLGQLVRQLVNSEKPAGEHLVEWDGKDNSGATVSTGIYFYRVQSDSFAQSRKMVLLK